MGAVDREDINACSFGNVLGEATCVLRADILMCITEQVGDIFSCGSEREVRIGGENRTKTDD